MPREIPNCPDKPNPAQDASRNYEIELITPMFGGGGEPRVVDPSFPIRTTAIRGQLQFWWRATVGSQYQTLAELRSAQSEVWGSTEHASRVQVLVENVQASDPSPCGRYTPRENGTLQLSWDSPFAGQQNALAYALFSFQGKLSEDRRRIEEAPSSFIATASFRLVLRCPEDLWAQVEPAVWAWANFGGMGDRTRRGCGAILCKELAPRDPTHLAEQLKRFVPQQSDVREWPTIPRSALACVQPGTPIEVWTWLIGLFKHFRQGPGFARNQGRQANRPGRSRYPEPESIRRVTNQRSRQHDRLTHIPDDAFPRAELGLPIVFHYQGQGEPPNPVLYPSNGPDGKRRERMASPLILKPLALASGQAIALILRLTVPHLDTVDLRSDDVSLPLPPTTTIQDPRLASYRDSPLMNSPNGSAIEAFLALAQNTGNGFVEVYQ